MQREFLKIQTDLERRVRERATALEKERNFVSAILDTAGALILVVDRDGRIIRFNRACEETSGYALAEVTGRPLWDLQPDDASARQVRDVVEAISRGDFPRKHEGVWAAPNGGTRLIAWSTTGLRSPGGQVEYGVWIGLDITERKQAEAELRSSEERYRALIENVKDGVALIQDDRLLFVNDAFLSMFGQEDPARLSGTRMVDLVAPASKERFVQFMGTALDRKSWGLTFRGECLRGGEVFWAEILSSAIRHRERPAILVTVRDITENMLWEQAIKQEAEYFRSENVRLKSSIGERYRLVDLIGKSPAMQRIYERILKAAATDANVILSGRSGTGKELVARAIHELSDRSEGPFVPVNCGAIPEALIESEFFGHRRGAFTGAHADKKGLLDAAHGGALFLDEVGDIGLNMQVKLLRALESGEYTPVGDHRARVAEVRIISATNQDPVRLVKAGVLREDFFYRISVIPITLPPLKDRKEDIPLLVEHFLGRYGVPDRSAALPPEVMGALLKYDWPGNVRELQNVLQRYLTVRSLDFMGLGSAAGPSEPSAAPPPDPLPTGEDLQTALEKVERGMIRQALEDHRWNKTRTAGALGISRRSLFRRMQRLGV